MLYRQVGLKDRDAFVSSLEIGDEITLAKPGAFQSTSVNPRYPHIASWYSTSVMFEIKARSGAAIGNITEGGGTAKEAEVLLPRNLKFRVVSKQPAQLFGEQPKTRGLGERNDRYVIQVEEIE